MADKNKQTANFGFQQIGGSQELEPLDYNNILAAIDANLPVGVLASVVTPGTGVGAAIPSAAGIKQLRLTLTAVVVAATNANKYGSSKILTWQNSNLALFAARMNLTGTKDGAQIESTDEPTVAIGSAAASNTTLSSTMIDTVDIVTLAATLAALAQKNGKATQGERYIAAGSTNYLYLNIGATGNSGGGDGSVTFSGTVDLFFADFGTFG